jgi:hypothetical protein
MMSFHEPGLRAEQLLVGHSKTHAFMLQSRLNSHRGRLQTDIPQDVVDPLLQVRPDPMFRACDELIVAGLIEHS